MKNISLDQPIENIVDSLNNLSKDSPTIQKIMGKFCKDSENIESFELIRSNEIKLICVNSNEDIGIVEYYIPVSLIVETMKNKTI